MRARNARCIVLLGRQAGDRMFIKPFRPLVSDRITPIQQLLACLPPSVSAAVRRGSIKTAVDRQQPPRLRRSLQPVSPAELVACVRPHRNSVAHGNPLGCHRNMVPLFGNPKEVSLSAVWVLFITSDARSLLYLKLIPLGALQAIGSDIVKTALMFGH